MCPLDRLLHSDLAKLTEDYRRACSDRESSRQEVENLKLQLQGYVSEVKRAEELLTMKVCKMCGSTFVHEVGGLWKEAALRVFLYHCSIHPERLRKK